MRYKRKPESEIVEIKKRQLKESKNPIVPLIIALATVLTSFIIASFLPAKFEDPSGPSFKIFFVSLAMGVGTFFILYLIQIFKRRKLIDDTYFGVCNRCLQTNHEDKTECSCGGTIESHEFYKRC